MRRQIFSTLIGTLAVLLPRPIDAAEMRVQAKPGSGPVTVYLDGKIEPRDFNRLDLLAEQRPKAQFVVVLNSPGGAHFSGLRIALLLRRIGAATVVPPGSTCLSACASIFFGGYDLRAKTPNRVVYQTA